MSAPETVRLKRKATDEPPEALILKRTRHVASKADDQPQHQYVRLKGIQDAEGTAPFVPSNGADASTAPAAAAPRPRRIFHLKRSSSPDSDSRKRQAHGPGGALATFVEQKAIIKPRNAARTAFSGDANLSLPPKRPGRGSAVKAVAGTSGTIPSAEAARRPRQHQDDLEALANDMHQFALDELASVPRPAARTGPKMSPAASRARHRQRMAAEAEAEQAAAPRGVDAEGDVDMDGDGEFVYDTYVLAPRAEGSESEGGKAGDVGFLVIDEDDQQLWESYLQNEHDEHGDRVDADDDDENAEDHYAADYPEDELDTDDEFDRHAYGFRGRLGSDDEQWEGGETPDWSDNDDDQKVMRAFARKTAVSTRWQSHVGLGEHESDEAAGRVDE